MYLKEFSSNMIISAITYLSYDATYGKLSVLRLVTEKSMQEDCSGVMVDKHTRRMAANTDGVHNHSGKRKKAAIYISCLAFFLNLSAQTVSAWAESNIQAAGKQTQDIQAADEQTENNQTGNNQIENSQIGNNQTENNQTEEKHAVTFTELNDEEVFLKQSQARVCTLTASTMMIRRAAMLSGNTDWRQITEKSVRKYAWAEKTGLKWNFTAAGISVAHKTLASKNELIQMLNKHPEGVVIYNSRKPHAILVTDYTNGILYCSDPSNDKPSGRYPITQASVTAESAGRCWYVKNPVDLTVVKTDAQQQSEQAVDGLLYRVLDQEKKTAVCTGRIAENTVVTVPETVMLNGMEYQVVQIAEGAFADSGKLKEITIGANVAEIEPKAFFQCKKLKKVTIHADNLKKIGTDAFGKIHKKARILIIGEQMETFAALLSGTSVPATATIGAGKQ